MSRLILHVGMPQTGSSSIQQTLFSWGGFKQFHYADLGVANHGEVIASLFEQDRFAKRGHRQVGRSSQEVEHFNQQALSRLEKLCEAKGQPIISGEDIWHLSEQGLEKVRDFFIKYFDHIEVISYVTPPSSFMVASFQEGVKKHSLASLRLESHYPHYREKIEKFDRVFGQENVTLRLFDPKQLVGRDVVIDFCHLLGESISPEHIQHVNESMSLEATAVLFTYRREGTQYAHYKGKARDNNALVDSLIGFGASEMRFADALIAPVVKRHRSDIDWMEKRLGQPMTDQSNEDTNAIASEAQLLEVASRQFDTLETYVNKQVNQVEPTPKQLAHWIEKLRTAIAGRSSNGVAPLYDGSQVFFTDEQMSLLEDDKLSPVIALREMGLSFERHGRIDEAQSVIEAALTLRPNAKGLLVLQQRLNVKQKVKVSKSLGGVRLEKEKGIKLTRQFLQSLSSSKRVDTMRQALDGGLQGISFGGFFKLRCYFFDNWESAVLQSFEKNPSSATCIRLLAFHYSRKGLPQKSNFYLKKLFNIHGNKPNDSVRQFFRNQIVAGTVSNGIGEGEVNWNAVEPFFKNSLSASSYEFQLCVAANKDGYINGLSCREELAEFMKELGKAKELLQVTEDVSARRDWSVALKMIKEARTIAVVGKGNSAKDLGLGETIDSHDLVLRVNHSGSSDSATDFGEKTSVVFHGRHLTGNFQELVEAGSTCAVTFSGFPNYVARKDSLEIPNEYRLEYFLDAICYKRATTGLRLLIALSVLLELRPDVEIRAFGFDFYTCPAPGENSVNDVRNSAGAAHEIDYEKWFAHEFLPLFTALRHPGSALSDYFR